jgi:hypothetical protein
MPITEEVATVAAPRTSDFQSAQEGVGEETGVAGESGVPLVGDRVVKIHQR